MGLTLRTASSSPEASFVAGDTGSLRVTLCEEEGSNCCTIMNVGENSDRGETAFQEGATDTFQGSELGKPQKSAIFVLKRVTFFFLFSLY